jgi:thiol-disulfide isomerase/thioredoxin
MKTFLFGLCCALFTITAARAGELGAPAAPLKISEWVKGNPVDLAAAKGKQVVVVEFWATWCPPCRTSIPHLTDMQKKFKDAIFIGVTDEESDVVKKFVTKMGDKMEYVVAIDDAGQTSKGYMREFGVNGIPHAFIVDKEGRVVWHGHPMAGLDKALEEVQTGKLDLEKAKKREAAQAKLNEFYKAASTDAASEKLDQLGQELEALDAELGGIQPGQKFDAAEIRKMARFQTLLREYQNALQSSPSNANLAQLEQELEAMAPKNFKLADIKESIAVRNMFMKYYSAVTGQSGADKLADYRAELAGMKINSPEALNQIAWTILTDPKIKTRDVELAAQLAKAGVAVSDGKQPAVLDTYARALFDSGKLSEAIEQQKKAIAAAYDEQMKKELGQTLKKYQEKTTALPGT